MTQELYDFGLEVFNGEKEKFERFLENNKNLTEKELEELLQKFNYGNW